jgi:hypothetical protein
MFLQHPWIIVSFFRNSLLHCKKGIREMQVGSCVLVTAQAQICLPEQSMWDLLAVEIRSDHAVRIKFCFDIKNLISLPAECIYGFNTLFGINGDSPPEDQNLLVFRREVFVYLYTTCGLRDITRNM